MWEGVDGGGMEDDDQGTDGRVNVGVDGHWLCTFESRNTGLKKQYPLICPTPSLCREPFDSFKMYSFIYIFFNSFCSISLLFIIHLSALDV